MEICSQVLKCVVWQGRGYSHTTKYFLLYGHNNLCIRKCSDIFKTEATISLYNTTLPYLNE